MHLNIHSGTIYNSHDMEIASMSTNTYMDKEDVVYKHACVLCSFSCVQLFVTLWTVAHQIPLSLGFSRQQYSGGLSRPPPRYLSDSGIKLASLVAPALQVDSFLLSHMGNPCVPICLHTHTHIHTHTHNGILLSHKKE